MALRTETTPVRSAPRRIRGSRGAVVAASLLWLSAAFVSAGFALDLTAAHRAGTRLSDALEAAAREGARSTGIARATNAFGVSDAVWTEGLNATDITDVRLDVDRTESDTIHVRLSGLTTAPVRFGKLLGRDIAVVARQSEAIRYPIDMTIVVDASFSLHRNGGLPALRDAVAEFVGQFEEDVDRIGLVTYSTWAAERVELRRDFRGPIAASLAQLSPITDAATDEGLRVAKQSLANAGQRATAERVVVLFTDGPPTAYADRFPMPDRTSPAYFDGIVAAYINGPSYRGLFSSADGRKVRYFSDSGIAITTDNASYATSVAPKYLPGKYRVDGHNIRAQAAAHAQNRANLLRADDTTLYVVGYRGRTPEPEHRADVPDLAFVRRLANHGGRLDRGAPAGRAVLAGQPEDLGPAFARIADDILGNAVRSEIR